MTLSQEVKWEAALRLVGVVCDVALLPVKNLDLPFTSDARMVHGENRLAQLAIPNGATTDEMVKHHTLGHRLFPSACGGFGRAPRNATIAVMRATSQPIPRIERHPAAPDVATAKRNPE
jgi:hypothetical protein